MKINPRTKMGLKIKCSGCTYFFLPLHFQFDKNYEVQCSYYIQFTNSIVVTFLFSNRLLLFSHQFFFWFAYFWNKFLSVSPFKVSTARIIQLLARAMGRGPGLTDYADETTILTKVTSIDGNQRGLLSADFRFRCLQADENSLHHTSSEAENET